MNVVWLSVKEGTPARGYWDQVLLERLFKDAFHYVVETETWPRLDGAVVVIPGAYQGEYITEINRFLRKLKWCVVIITSDEENNFPIDELKHKNMVVYATYPNAKYKTVIRWLPIGPARNPMDSRIFDTLPVKDINWVFAGQVNHEARERYVEVLKTRTDGDLQISGGFAQGLEHAAYHDLLNRAKVVPAPRGNISPDSFRLYEAIEAGATPIPQDVWFWQTLFGDYPFPVIESYDQLNGYLDDAIKAYPVLNNRVQAWWINQFYHYQKLIEVDVERLSGKSPNNRVITVMIPVSSIKSHPDTSILDETIKSIRHHLPDEKIILTFDGVRKEHEYRRGSYEEFIRRVLYKCFFEWHNVQPLIFEKHTHQVGMAREALKYVDTPLLLYAEQDTPLTPDVEIEWPRLITDELLGNSNMIRFHFEALIPKEHEIMMLGMDARSESPLMMTCQWSQRPHLATTAFYRRILDNHFSPNAKSFIEDKMHGVLHAAYLDDGMLGWEQFKVHIYHPEGNIKRSYHTDGRAGEEKYDDKQVF